MEFVRRVPKVCGIKTYARSPSGCLLLLLLLLLLLPPPPPPHWRDFFRSLYTRSCVIYRREAKYVPVGGTLLERNSFNDFFFFFCSNSPFFCLETSCESCTRETRKIYPFFIRNVFLKSLVSGLKFKSLLVKSRYRISG